VEIELQALDIEQVAENQLHFGFPSLNAGFFEYITLLGYEAGKILYQFS
jgi:hypothetical protein